jgi:hypothetical protein
MDQAMSDLVAPDLVAPCLPVVAHCYYKAEFRAALHRVTFDRAGPDFVWVASPGVRMERWVLDNQDWKAPHVRHRRIP